ncbi:hypothetical protein FACS1894147_06530 [Spirochaetia bacterium]|nr:hypothetical protein FACS1894147_06530 [Spirochaetia bacterium]
MVDLFIFNEINERDKTVSDVLCHLHAWHEMLGDWYKIGMKGKIPEMPMEGYNWKQLTAVNEIIYEKYKGTDIKIAARDFKNSHNKLMKIMESHNNKELFETLPYEWTGKIMLGIFFDSNMSHHYQWGLKTLKRLNKFIRKINNRG